MDALLATQQGIDYRYLSMEDTNKKAKLPPTVGQEAKGWFGRHRVTIILTVVLVLGNLGTYLYQNHKQQKQRDAYAEELQSRGQEMAALVELRNAQQVQALGKALANSVRAEMIRGNKEQLNQFLIEMVQQSEVQTVMVVDSVGIVYLSTDKQYENKFILDVIPTVPRVVSEPIVVEVSEQDALYAAPINALNHQIATMVMQYTVGRKTQEVLKKVKSMELSSGKKEKPESEE